MENLNKQIHDYLKENLSLSIDKIWCEKGLLDDSVIRISLKLKDKENEEIISSIDLTEEDLKYPVKDIWSNS